MNWDQGSIIQNAAQVFNNEFLQPGSDPVKVYAWEFNYTCTIKDFTSSLYGKYDAQYNDTLMFMELSHYFSYAI